MIQEHWGNSLWLVTEKGNITIQMAKSKENKKKKKKKEGKERERIR